MENYKNTSRPESQSAKNEPWSPDYQKTSLKQNPSENPEIDDDSSELYPNDISILGTLNSYHPDDDEDEYEDNDENEDEDDEDDYDLDNPPIEEEGNFEEKDDDYREKKEGDFF